MRIIFYIHKQCVGAQRWIWGRIRVWDREPDSCLSSGSGLEPLWAHQRWSLQHLAGVLRLSPCLFSLLSCIHLIGKIFSWQPHLSAELWERCQPAHSSFPTEAERASYPNCRSLNLSLCLSGTGNHHLVNHLEPHSDWFTNYTPGRLSSALKNAVFLHKGFRTGNGTWKEKIDRKQNTSSTSPRNYRMFLNRIPALDVKGMHLSVQWR